MRARLPQTPRDQVSVLRYAGVLVLAVLALLVVARLFSPSMDEDAWVHELPGLVVQGSSVWLTQQPTESVFVATKCDAAGAVEIPPDAWEVPRVLKLGACDVLVCTSKDRRYDGLHVRIADPDEKIGEWVPEEVFEAGEGAAKVLAPLERSRSAFDFPSAGGFACQKSREVRHLLACVLPNTTVPFYIADPKGGLDEDGWNSFPVVLIIAAGHPLGTGLAGVHAATHVARFWRPRRGRLVVVPNVNQRRLDGDDATADLARDFAESEPATALARALWRLCAVLRPDLYFDVDEFADGEPHVVATPEAVPLAELMVKESGQKMAISEGALSSRTH